MKNYVVVPGHHREARGATSYSGLSEWDFNRHVCNFLKLIDNYRQLTGTSKINLLVSNDKTDTADIIEKSRIFYTSPNQVLPDPYIVLELHCNAYKDKAFGTEVLCHSKSPVAKKVANYFATRISKAMGFRLRSNDGVKPVSYGERGFANIENHMHNGADEALLIEPTFFNYETYEAKKLIEHPALYADVLYSIMENGQ